jgi:hypothetical protein
LLENSPGLEAKTLFEHLQWVHPGRFQDGQLRTLQRKVKQWRAAEGPSREAFFSQQHHPGRLCASDFTHMEELGVLIQGQSFPHLIYHFVLTYSNWEAGTVCFSESFESLSEGLQNACIRESPKASLGDSKLYSVLALADAIRSGRARERNLAVELLREVLNAYPNLPLLEDAVRKLAPSLDEIVFVGGIMLGLLTTDEGATPILATTDVDVIAEIVTYADYIAFLDRIRQVHFTEDDGENALTCRWHHGALTLDVLALLLPSFLERRWKRFARVERWTTSPVTTLRTLSQ